MSTILPGKEGCWDTATIMSSFRIDKAGRLIIGTMGNSEGFGKYIHSDLMSIKKTITGHLVFGDFYLLILQNREDF